MALEDSAAITAARQTYVKAAELLETRIAQRATAKQGLIDAQARLNTADDLYDTAAQAVDNTFDALRMLVEEARKVAAEEAHDRAGEQWQEAAYQPAPPDPYSGGGS
jgi:hypothetical protein